MGNYRLRWNRETHRRPKTSSAKFLTKESQPGFQLASAKKSFFSSFVDILCYLFMVRSEESGKKAPLITVGCSSFIGLTSRYAREVDKNSSLFNTKRKSKFSSKKST
jgi:hypothetical protein